MRNIIITGGGSFNKGAQAMTFIAVSEIKKRFPKHRVLLLSEMDLERPKTERERYAFDFIGWYPIKFAKCQHNKVLRLICKIRNGKELAQAEAIYTNCDAMIDLSGYALGSNWERHINTYYLDHLEFAKSFGIPVYLMPQSFGPFDFADDIDARCRKLLPTAKAILAREKAGYDALVKTYGLTNVQMAPDLVLNNREIDVKHIFREMPEFDLPEILPGSIAVIPNGRNLSVGHAERVLELYASAIDYALSVGKNVYLLHHASSDAEICAQLKVRFAEEKRVILLEQEFSCLEFNELVRRFDYLIASRFHSIVHAFKNGTPCIVLGWAEKYHELLRQFSQERYMFDVRDEIREQDMHAAMMHMENCREEEREKIKAALADVQKQNVFDILSDVAKEIS